MIAQTYEDSEIIEYETGDCCILIQFISSNFLQFLVINGIILLGLSMFTHVFSQNTAYFASLIGSVMLGLIVFLLWGARSNPMELRKEDSIDPIL